MAACAVSLRKSHDIVILLYCNIVKGQANYKSLHVICILTHFQLNLECCKRLTLEDID